MTPPHLATTAYKLIAFVTLALVVGTTPLNSQGRGGGPQGGLPQLQQDVATLAARVAALEVAPPSGSGLRVVDAVNQEVGILLGPGRVVRFENNEWLAFFVSKGGFQATGVTFRYASPDCTGPPFMDVDPNVPTVAKTLDGILFYHPGTPAMSQFIGSRTSIFGFCSSDGSIRTVAPVMQVDLSSFGYLPDFEIVQ